MFIPHCLEKSLQTKKRGGVGVLNLKLQNEALLMKFLHKLYNKEDTPWVTLLWKSYDQEKIPHAMDPCGSFWWKDILKLAPIFRNIASCQVGQGNIVLFWKDVWMGEVAVEHCPRAFSFALDEDISVKKFLSAPRLASDFSLPVYPEAMTEIGALQEASRDIDFALANSERWTYIWGSSHYTSQKYYQYCFKDIIPHVAFKWIWKSKCTPKFKFFCWLLLSDRLNTRNMLKRRQMHLNASFNCPMCSNSTEETVEHLFFHCPFSKSCYGKLQMKWDSQGTRLEYNTAG
jgi:hypothetical protein